MMKKPPNRDVEPTGSTAPAAGGWFYPRFSCQADLGLFRLGGSGLGNHLYIWAKALVLARRHGGANVFPTWPQLKLGPIIRREPDPRHYMGLFHPSEGDVAGLRKMAVLATAPRTALARVGDLQHAGRRLYIVTDEAFADQFEELLDHREFVRDAFARRSVRLPDRLEAPFIGVHVRFGDFVAPAPGETSGAVNHRLPLEWYTDRLQVIRRAVGAEVPAMIFSDASEAELAPLLAQPNVVMRKGGTALDDIWKLSQAAAIVASGSTFSYWAGYLGDGLVVSRSGAWRTTFDLQPREWICGPSDQVMPTGLIPTLRRHGL